jgi:hypothetical protein
MSLSLSLRLALGPQGGAAAALLDLTTLFGGGEAGAWYDPNILGTVWQDTAGTTPGAVGSPVARLNASAGTFSPLLQATAAAQPILRLNATTGYHYLEFDNTDDAMVTGTTQAFSTGGIATLMVGVIGRGASRYGTHLSFGIGGSSNHYGLSNNGLVTNYVPSVVSRGSALASATATDQLPAPAELVLTGRMAHLTDLCELRINGSVAATSATDQGTAGFNARTVTVGLGSSAYNSDWYGGLMIGRALTTQEIEQAEDALAARVGVVI